MPSGPCQAGREDPSSTIFMTESFAQLFEQSIASQRIKPGTILTGHVVEVGSDYVIVNVGLKSEAVIPAEQFRSEKGEMEVKAGDEVEVALDTDRKSTRLNSSH